MDNDSHILDVDAKKCFAQCAALKRTLAFRQHSEEDTRYYLHTAVNTFAQTALQI